MHDAAYNDKILRECATVGAAVLASQRVEFLLYGLVAHLNDELKIVDKRFRDFYARDISSRRPIESSCDTRSTCQEVRS